jgi:hypothetical protein
MKVAGKYAGSTQPYFEPDVFPNQQLMHVLAAQTDDQQLKNALLDFQYPFKESDLKNSGYSPAIQKIVMDATIGKLG